MFSTVVAQKEKLIRRVRSNRFLHQWPSSSVVTGPSRRW